MDYIGIYNLEKYLFEQVSRRFRKKRTLSAFDFFCIVIWKANRAKSKVAKRLLSATELGDLERNVEELCRDLSGKKTHKERMQVLMEKWKLRLPMASAILTVLYPEELTVYDVRVVGVLNVDEVTRDRMSRLTNQGWSEDLWLGYEEFVESVKTSAPSELSLRDKDRWLWGKSFCIQLIDDLRGHFEKEPDKRQHLHQARNKKSARGPIRHVKM